MTKSHIQEQVNLVVRHEQEVLEERTNSERLGDKIADFAGSSTFVGLHLLMFLGWIAVIQRSIACIRQFVPFPFSLLVSLIVSEQIFLQASSSCVSRVRRDERDYLTSQIFQSKEKEITAVLGRNCQMAKTFWLKQVENELGDQRAQEKDIN
jgi:uncharacterized membrane protein